MIRRLDIPDQAARDRIENDIDHNLVVEAGAGAGKTSCLVKRLLTLFRRGGLAGEGRLAAVTFTHKAAAELRERLDKSLEQAIGSLPEGEGKETLRAARTAIPECHIGTIHSFCSRLLRERPVEAGIGPDFQELDETRDEALRDQAWDEFSRRLLRGEFPEIYGALAESGLNAETLRSGFKTFANYPDVDTWGATGSGPPPDYDGFVAGVKQYVASQDDVKDPILRAGDLRQGKLPALLRTLIRRCRRMPGNWSREAVLQMDGLFPENLENVQAEWETFGSSKAIGKVKFEEYTTFFSKTVLPFRHARMAALYAVVLSAFFAAEKIYKRLRREAGGVNFQDLLLLTVRLLREHPPVRRDFARRYARLLVDETQDTDPLQAELLFLLASSDPEEKDWRRCLPRPGALFIVGDPKQSIYRFRRADIAIYQEMKTLLEKAGGAALTLTANFRSRPEILHWVNRVYGPREKSEGAADSGAERFSDRDTPEGPRYVPLESRRSGQVAEECLSGVYRLDLPAQNDNRADNPDADEAGRIARFIRRAADQGIRIPVHDADGETFRPVRPGDFLILTWANDHVADFAQAFRRFELNCRVSGGLPLQDSATLALLSGYLDALAQPDNPVPTLGVLRGGLFGISDPDLYRWKRGGGDFFFARFSPKEDKNIKNPVSRSLDIMAEHYRLLERRSPIEALVPILDDLGFWAHSCLGGEGLNGAGTLAAAVELLRAEGGNLSTPAKLADRLAVLINSFKGETLPAIADTGEAVRVMNIHKAKGLEAPVVFLTSHRRKGTHPVSLAIQRGSNGTSGAILVCRSNSRSFAAQPLARPLDWDELANRERRFLAAERTRLNYVAATRAGAVLVLSLHPVKNGKKLLWKNVFAPDFPEDSLELPDRRLPESAAAAPIEVPKLAEYDEAELFRLAKERERHLVSLGEVAQAAAAGGRPESEVLPPDDVLARGEMLHCLLEAFASAADTGDLIGRAAELLREHGLPDDEAGEMARIVLAAHTSEIWRRAAAADRVYREAPYFLPVSGPDGKERLERGVIDLVFRETDGWVVVDYKTGGSRSGIDPREAAREHAPQLTAYARAWSRLTDEPVKETGVYFLRAGLYVAVGSGAD
ncbi:MAG: UvrD-helicase domain-containing protein [Planctomycetota bacterium]|jgi:ATP-dependent helicase/nuclease subunit A|nr:UvrD-helicase domain-containing protein [Planctomycetota bacterium]